MANEIHGYKDFNAVTPAEIDFGTEEGTAHDILVSGYAIHGNNDYHIAHDEDAGVTHHLMPANTYISHNIPCRKLSIFGAGGATGRVWWIATPLHGTEGVSDIEAWTHRGGVDC